LLAKYKVIWVYLISILFIGANIFLVWKEIYLGYALPFILFIIILHFISLEKVLMLTVFLTPLSIVIGAEHFGASFSLPTEPLLLGMLLIFVLSMIYKRRYDFRILKHPITIIIILHLFWMLITSVTSEFPIISLKAFIARLWFVIPMFFLGAIVFKDLPKIKQFIWLYIFPFVVVIIYTLINHAQYGFEQHTGNLVMRPFYNDHTAYGAMLAFFIPPIVYFSFSKKMEGREKFIARIALVIFLIAVIFSYSRAAWLGLIAGIGVYIAVKLRIKFTWIVSVLTILISLFFTFQNEIIDSLERNKQDSSTNFTDHIYSMTNISTDASNLERINRWHAALRLFEERPVFGWGPGTYQFVYAPYQISSEKTIISTNAGDMGNAHSEYLGPLAEEGLIGMLLVILLLAFTIYRGIDIYIKNKHNKYGELSLVIIVSLITYFTHGIMNNFLDTDKASIPFWGFIAIIVILDITQKEKHSNKKSNDLS
jgi:O-antigen ligase